MLGQVAEVITGEDILGDPITLEQLDAIEEDADEVEEEESQGQGKKKKKKNKEKRGQFAARPGEA